MIKCSNHTMTSGQSQFFIFKMYRKSLYYKLDKTNTVSINISIDWPLVTSLFPNIMSLSSQPHTISRIVNFIHRLITTHDMQGGYSSMISAAHYLKMKHFLLFWHWLWALILIISICLVKANKTNWSDFLHIMTL